MRCEGWHEPGSARGHAGTVKVDGEYVPDWAKLSEQVEQLLWSYVVAVSRWSVSYAEVATSQVGYVLTSSSSRTELCVWSQPLFYHVGHREHR
jgi:hypothetical protein